MRPCQQNNLHTEKENIARIQPHSLRSPVSYCPNSQTLHLLLRAADSAQDKAALIDLRSKPNIFSLLQSAAANSTLCVDVAHLFSKLSAENNAADLLSRAPFVSLIDKLLTKIPPHPALRHATSAVRNITAHSISFAHSLARNSDTVRCLIILLQHPSQSDDDTAEIAAALANFARSGLQCQAYARKHGAIQALVRAATTLGNSTRFHSCRALAEYSLEPKWLVLLVSENCVGLMIRVLERDSDEEIISEATRFLGNVATTKVGREAILNSGGVERVIARVATLPENSLLDLRVDLLRTVSNLCVNSKESAARVIARGGLTPFVNTYFAAHNSSVQTEAFRGLLIIAQATHAARAAVLREIGIKIRQEASKGHCVASLYDLLRRVKVEASAERSDDFPQTIADLGARSKQYLFRAGPLATQQERNNSSANSVPDLESPAIEPFRQSGRLLSVQRPVLHRDRLERERRERAMAGDQPCSSDISSLSSGGLQRQITLKRPHTPRQDSDKRPLDECQDQERNGSGVSPVVKRDRGDDAIPRCRVLEACKSDQSAGEWVKAVWSAVCSAVSQNANPLIDFPLISSVHGGNGNGAVGAGQSNSSGGVDVFPTPQQEEDLYQIGFALGRGGFATVYLAKNLRTGELVAVKRFHPPSPVSQDSQLKAETSFRRAIKEQRIWDGLAHKNIVSYKGCFFGEQGEFNLIAEYIPGWSLADHLSQITRFPEHMVACITVQIVAGLDYLHKCGVTHRDVKPANILVDPDGVIKITDFGVSSAVDVPTMTGNTIVGTPWYIAPEMIEGRPYGKSVDIWSLGCTVIELATGKRPYHHLRPHVAMFRMTQDRMPPIPKSISSVLRGFLKTCWVWDPAQRPTPAHLKRHPFLASISRPEVTNLKNLARKAP